MANNSGTNGLVPVRMQTGAALGKGNEYEILAAYGTAMFLGDPAIGVSTSSTLDGCPDIQQWSEGANLLLGGVLQFRAVLTNLTLQYHLASTLQRCIVEDDPSTIFRIPHDGTSASTDVFKYASIEVGTGSTTTGLSGSTLDSSSISATATTSLPLKIMRANPAIGDPINNATSGSLVEVIIVNHQLSQ